MVNFINVAVLVLNSVIAMFFAGIYLLNLFKKKSILKRMDMYGDSDREFSFWAAIILGAIASAYYVQAPDKLYGLSLGVCINLLIIGVILVVVILDAVGTWFNDLPET